MIIAPIVNLNGTPRERLVEQRTEASQAIDLALRALEGMAPNPRDYFGREDSYGAAVTLHRQRLQALEAVKADVDAEAEAVAG